MIDPQKGAVADEGATLTEMTTRLEAGDGGESAPGRRERGASQCKCRILLVLKVF